jgi:protein-S-isoprenylcysteine O-methyltransferase Ste14
LECLLGLVVENSIFLFVKPLSGPQILSWVLLLGSIPLASHALYVLRRTGMPKGSIGTTTQLVRGDVFRYMRHPLYASLILLGWGAALKYPSLPVLDLAGAVTILLYWTAYFEERELLGRFGQRYVDYRRASKRFIPFVVESLALSAGLVSGTWRGLEISLGLRESACCPPLGRGMRRMARQLPFLWGFVVRIPCWQPISRTRSIIPPHARARNLSGPHPRGD